MQLNSDRRVRLALAAATGALLGPSCAHAGQWSFDSQFLYYGENGRVSLFEPVVSARWDRGDGHLWNFRLTVDSLTGASASGAVPSDQPQTYTTPSGNSSYTVRPRETPLDPSFLDTRFALNLGWERPLSPLWRVTLGANVSTEYDYQSASVSGTLARDFNRHNTTLSGGLSLGHDFIDPVGGVPRGLAPMSPLVPGSGAAGPTNRAGSAEDKAIYDLLISLTQVLDQRSLIQINYGYGRSSGYLNDPYKLVSVIDTQAGPNGGHPVAQLYEARPDTRTKQNVYLSYKRGVGRDDVVDVSYRYLWDTWQVRSHTLDLRYRWDFASAGYWQPHVRYYRQTAADFYRRFLPETDLPPPGTVAYASADYRLGELTGVTFGLKYGHPTVRGHEWNVKLEYYSQSGDEPPTPPGALADLELFPTVNAFMVQCGYTF